MPLATAYDPGYDQIIYNGTRADRKLTDCRLEAVNQLLELIWNEGPTITANPKVRYSRRLVRM